MTDAAQVYRMTIAQPASVTGYGTVYQADIRAGGVSFASSIALAGYTLADGVTATIGGKTVSDSSESGVRPASITIDRSDTAALDAGAGISVRWEQRWERVTCDGQTLAAQTDYNANRFRNPFASRLSACARTGKAYGGAYSVGWQPRERIACYN